MESILPGLFSVMNIHPLLVHCPIALFPLALALEVLAVWRRDTFFHKMACCLVYVGTLSAIFAVGTGFWAAADMGHNHPGHDLVHIHRNFMVATTISALILSVFIFYNRHHYYADSAHFMIIGLVIVVALLLLGADRGGLLVFKHGIGVKNVPPPISEHEHDNGHHNHHEH